MVIEPATTRLAPSRFQPLSDSAGTPAGQSQAAPCMPSTVTIGASVTTALTRETSQCSSASAKQP